MTDVNNDSRNTVSLEEQLTNAAEELITGDSDDPPLSEEAIFEMLKMASNDRKLGLVGSNPNPPIEMGVLIRGSEASMRQH